jgi:hypothetical protein
MGRYVKGSRTAAVDVLTWFLLVTAILSVLIRLGTKCWIFRKLTRDDYLSILSLVGVSLARNGRTQNNSSRCSAPRSLSHCRWQRPTATVDISRT